MEILTDVAASKLGLGENLHGDTAVFSDEAHGEDGGAAKLAQKASGRRLSPL